MIRPPSILTVKAASFLTLCDKHLLKGEGKGMWPGAGLRLIDGLLIILLRQDLMY